MLNVVNTSTIVGNDVTDNVTTLHSPIYILHCEDSVGNEFEIETNKETYIQFTDFLDKLRSI
jgi:hypothetical protein